MQRNLSINQYINQSVTQTLCPDLILHVFHVDFAIVNLLYSKMTLIIILWVQIIKNLFNFFLFIFFATKGKDVSVCPTEANRRSGGDIWWPEGILQNNNWTLFIYPYNNHSFKIMTLTMSAISHFESMI